MPETRASLSLLLLALSEMTTGRALDTTQAKLWLSRAKHGLDGGHAAPAPSHRNAPSPGAGRQEFRLQS